MNNKIINIQKSTFFLAVCFFVLFVLDATSQTIISPTQSVKEDKSMTTKNELENLIAQGDWSAVDLVVKMGEAAWPVIKQGAKMDSYESRQVSMVAAGRLGGISAGEILLSGLRDKHINVVLVAAGQLSKKPPLSAHSGILDEINTCNEGDVCELLALSLGQIPGEKSINALLNLLNKDLQEDDVEKNAQLALVKLGHPKYIKKHLKNLDSKDAYERYKTIANFVYIDDTKYAKEIKRHLVDKEVALVIGTQYKPRYRRVCDQAVDSLVFVYKLTPSFEIKAENIYSDKQIAEINEIFKNI